VLDAEDPRGHDRPMSWIQDATSDDDPTGEVAEAFEKDRSSLGYVAGYTRVFAHRPAVLRAWQGLNGAIKGMDARRYEVATTAAALRLRSSYCALAHGKVLVDGGFLTEDEVVDLARGRPTKSLDAVDRAVFELADAVAADATAVTREDVERLRDLGLTDAEILDVVLAAAVRCFYSKTLDALGVEPDAAYGDLPGSLREALTVGRPIAPS
jgi:uncharacterized peroxidase-related enzyme